MLVGDRDKISQILRNFLSNAFKFTSEGSVILKAEMDKDRENDVIFSVTDTGIGIPEEHISDIFQEFRQVDGTISRKYGDRTWFVHIKETCRPYERRNRSPKQNWRGKYVFPQTARSCLQKRGWQGKGDGKERHGQENLNGSKK